MIALPLISDCANAVNVTTHKMMATPMISSCKIPTILEIWKMEENET